MFSLFAFFSGITLSSCFRMQSTKERTKSYFDCFADLQLVLNNVVIRTIVIQCKTTFCFGFNERFYWIFFHNNVLFRFFVVEFLVVVSFLLLTRVNCFTIRTAPNAFILIKKIKHKTIEWANKNFKQNRRQ